MQTESVQSSLLVNRRSRSGKFNIWIGTKPWVELHSVNDWRKPLLALVLPDLPDLRLLSLILPDLPDLRLRDLRLRVRSKRSLLPSNFLPGAESQMSWAVTAPINNKVV